MIVNRIILFCMNAPLSLLASGALTQFLLTLLNLNLNKYLLIFLQSSIFIITLICFNKKQIIFLRPKINLIFFMNVVVLFFAMLSIYHLLSFHTYYATDLINTSNLLNNLDANRVYSGLVDPNIYRDGYRFTQDSSGSVISSADVFDSGSILFYPSGALFSINFIQFFTNIFAVFSLIEVQIYFMLFIIAYLYFYIFNYLSIVNSKYVSFIFQLLLLFNFFPSYLIVAGDLALLSSYIYAIIIALYHFDSNLGIISLTMHIVIIIFLHPLALFVLFLRLLLNRRLLNV